MEGAELAELRERSSSGPLAGHLKEDRGKKKTNQEKKVWGKDPGLGRSRALCSCSRAKLKATGAGHTHYYFHSLPKTGSKPDLQRDPRRRSRGFVTAEAVEPPPASRSYPCRAPRAVSDST